jgi:hypothetical protein
VLCRSGPIRLCRLCWLPAALTAASQPSSVHAVIQSASVIFFIGVCVAQWIERLPTEQEVWGSIPHTDSINYSFALYAVVCCVSCVVLADRWTRAVRSVREGGLQRREQ